MQANPGKRDDTDQVGCCCVAVIKGCAGLRIGRNTIKTQTEILSQANDNNRQTGTGSNLNDAC